jgi:hypothetical protein
VLRFAADENLNADIVRGLRRRRPDIDIARIQDFGLGGLTDLQVLEWAADEGRVLLTHDVATMSRYAYERVASDLSMPGVFEVSRAVPVGKAIEDLILIAECSLDDEWEGQVRFLPLR